ncbi:MAG: 50S ribosomal protein L17 [bacterium]|nr:50S ribosomal protein L17 [bacterium]
MVHRKKGRKLNRTASHRSALMSNLSISLILHKRISTTEAKAKELRRFIEPLVSKAIRALKFKDSSPEKNVHLRREARKFLNNKEALIILFDEIGEKIGDRPGGYTRVLKTGNRYGDGAKTAIIEFVDYSFAKEKKAKEIKEDAVQDAEESKNKKGSKPEVKKPVKKATVKKESAVKKEKKTDDKTPKTKKTTKKKAVDN